MYVDLVAEKSEVRSRLTGQCRMGRGRCWCVDTYAVRLFERHAVKLAALNISAILALAAGTSIYLFDRDWASALFLAPFADLQVGYAGLFGVLGGNLPSFFHAYAFALLLIILLGQATYARRLGASLWFTIAAALEFLQAGQAGAMISGSAALPAGPAFLERVQAYIANGHLDAGDLLATGLGCVAAYAISSILERRR